MVSIEKRKKEKLKERVNEIKEFNNVSSDDFIQRMTFENG